MAHQTQFSSSQLPKGSQKLDSGQKIYYDCSFQVLGREVSDFFLAYKIGKKPEILKIINSKFCIKGKWLSRKLMM
jgi:hypothetical protein